MNEPSSPFPNEPVITINGFPLSDAEAMTVRVALQSFLITLDPVDAMGKDDNGRKLRAGYLMQCRAINAKMRATL